MVCGNSALNSAEEQEYDDSIHSPQSSTQMSSPQTVIVWHFILPSYTSIVFYCVALVRSIITFQIFEFWYLKKLCLSPPLQYDCEDLYELFTAVSPTFRIVPM